jgi:hypothetical protein
MINHPIRVQNRKKRQRSFLFAVIVALFWRLNPALFYRFHNAIILSAARAEQAAHLLHFLCAWFVSSPCTPEKSHCFYCLIQAGSKSSSVRRASRSKRPSTVLLSRNEPFYSLLDAAMRDFQYI